MSVRALALVCLVALGGCERSASSTVAPAPSATAPIAFVAPSASAKPDRCAFDAARLADLRTRVAGLRPGMSHAEVDRALALDWSCFGAGGQGGPARFTVGYSITPAATLEIAWEARDGGQALTSAALHEKP